MLKIIAEVIFRNIVHVIRIEEYVKVAIFLPILFRLQMNIHVYVPESSLMYLTVSS